jgi:16S rRNA (adenine1518-N6/adenine1519-N6)-dimethyltransferase
LMEAPSAIIATAGLEETARAEQVPVEGFVRLANAWDESLGRGAPTSA